jgi:hypothetical protein
MKSLDPLKTSSLYDRFLSELLLVGFSQGHTSLTWGSHHRRVIAGEHDAELSPNLLPGSLRGITMSAATLADLADRSPRHGQFELIVEGHTVVVDVEIKGAATDTLVTLSWVASSEVRESASRALKRTLDLPPPYVTGDDDDDEASASDATKNSQGRTSRIACNLLQSLIIFTVGLPLLPFFLLAHKYHWFESKRARARRITIDAGREAIKSVEHAAPPGIDWLDWTSAVGLTSVAYLETEHEAHTEALRQLNQDLAAATQRPVNPELLTNLWDKLETLGPRSRAFVTRHRFELLEHLGGPIKL